MSEAHPKLARTDHPVHDLITARWSPYAFAPQAVERPKLLACLEAARWSASSYNEQPWSFLVAERDDETEFKRMLSCLVEANQAWAQQAGVLMITVASTAFTRNDKPNRMATHDVGLAVGNLTIQATALGLYVHQMAGVDLERTIAEYDIRPPHEPVTAIALGYAASEDSGDDALTQRDQATRSRKQLSAFVFAKSFGTAWPT